MNIGIFTNRILQINRQMVFEKRKILLLLDNAYVHPKDLELLNVELFFYPPNTTLKIQPLDQGIIKAFKDGNRKNLICDITSRVDTEREMLFEKYLAKITILNSILWTAELWKTYLKK